MTMPDQDLRSAAGHAGSVTRTLAALAGRGKAEPAAPSLALRLDEAAAAVHTLAWVRVTSSLVGVLIAGMIVPWTTSVAWLVGGLMVEAWCWFATRARSRGEAIGPTVRANFVLAYVILNLWWLLFGALLWSADTLQGQASGAVVFLVVGSLFVLMFYNTPLVFLAAGTAPAAGALTLIALADGRDWRQLLPIWLALGLSMSFIARRALDTPSAQESRRRLNDSLNDYRILADNVTDIIARMNLEGVNQYVSPACLAVLGYRPEELVGTSRHAMVDPRDVPTIVAAFRRMMADPTRSEVLTNRVRHKDGHWLWLQSSAKLVCENGIPVGLIDVSRDVTERVAADLALHEAKAEAEAASRAKADFLANVSHEIRTPMNAVLGALHLLEREPISPEGRELMRQANDCGRMLSQLLNDVLDFSKIEAGQLDLAPEAMDVGEALKTVTALLDGQAHAKGVELRCEITGDDLWIEADPVRLRQAMFNLVGNAVKFTAKGHVIIRLGIQPGAAGWRHVRLEVEDTGIGMTPEVQDHLFERFRQAESDTARRFGGTGLGLSITQALTRMMGGGISFASTEGVGSTFRLAFRAPAAKAAVVETVEGGMLDGVSILLVEDNPTNRLVARTLLTRLGARVGEAEDGVAGLEAARRGAHDLILMDVQMPHMDGIEATRAIRGLRGLASQVPIIGLTANIMAHQQAEYTAAGMNGVVGKPISPAILLTEIARVMAQAETRLAG
jgi:two-component system, sensor histidine kinase